MLNDIAVEGGIGADEEEVITEQPEAIVEEPEDVTEETEPEAGTEEPVKHNAQTRIRQLANEKALLKAELAEMADLLKSKTQPQLPTDNEVMGTGKPDPVDYIGGVFNAQYLEDLTDYKTELALARRDDQQAERVRVNAVKQREADFMADNPGYNAALDVVVGSKLIDDQLIYDALIDDENAPAIVFYLGNNPAVLAQIERLSPAQKLMRLGAIADSLASPETQPAAKATRAAKPLTPLSGTGVPVSKADKIAAAEKAGDYDTWKALQK